MICNTVLNSNIVNIVMMINGYIIFRLIEILIKNLFKKKVENGNFVHIKRRRMINMTDLTFNQRKKKLREYYKLFKARLIEWDNIPKEYQELLIKYYGVEEDRIKEEI